MYFKSVLAHLKSKVFSVCQPWWPTFFHTTNLLKSHVPSESAPGSDIIEDCLINDSYSKLLI